LEEKFFWRN